MRSFGGKRTLVPQYDSSNARHRGVLAARTALARSDDIAAEARWHHLLPLLFSLGSAHCDTRGARTTSAAVGRFPRTLARYLRARAREHDRTYRHRCGHRARHRNSHGKSDREVFRTAQVSANVKWRRLLTRSFSTLVRKCPTDSETVAVTVDRVAHWPSRSCDPCAPRDWLSYRQDASAAAAFTSLRHGRRGYTHAAGRLSLAIS